MIIRSLRLRHGRIALPRQLPLRRYQSSIETSESPESPSIAQPASLPVFSAPTKAAKASVETVIHEVPINDPNHPVAQDYAFFKHQQRHTKDVGASISPHYRPNELVNDPPRPSDITLELLMASQAPIGHSTSLWNPANARYIFGIRGEADPIHIISPDVTAAHLRRACKIVSGVTERGGLVLFVGTRAGQARCVVKAAELAQGCHLFTKWIPGSITNGQQILGRCEKQVVNELDQQVTGFEDQLFTKSAIKPDLVVCLNPLENYILLHECGLNNIPTIGIIDTDANPTWVTYPIPANDDSLRCVQVIAGVLGRAGEVGQEKRLREARKGFVVYPAIHGLSAPERQEERRPQRERRQQRVQTRASPQQIAAAEAASCDEQDFPEDFENVDVAQHDADQALLDEAEKASEQAFNLREVPAPARDGVEGAAAISTAEEASGMDASDEVDGTMDVYTAFNEGAEEEDIDPSLTDENYSVESNEAETEDLAQFGIHAEANPEAAERAESQADATTVAEGGLETATAPEFPIDQVGEVQEELHEKPEGESTLDQVADVEEELGEQAPEPEVPAGNPDVKDVDEASQAEVDAAIDAVKPEEPVVDRKDKGER